MAIKIAFAFITVGIFLISWMRWFREMFRAKREFDAQCETTFLLMEQAFREAHWLQDDLDEAWSKAMRRMNGQ